MNILSISGSLRKGSYNTALIKYASQNPPQGVKIEIFNISPIPIFNDDSAKEDTMPESVEAFKKKIESSDGILIASPEYNRTIPGPLKNAIDYASRPYGDNSWEGKVIGIMGASTGGIATALANYDLKKVFMHLKAYPVIDETMVGHAPDKIENGVLKDEKTKEHVKKLVEKMVDFHFKIAK